MCLCFHHCFYVIQFILQFLRGKLEQAKLVLAMHARFFRLKILRDERWNFPTYPQNLIASKTGYNTGVYNAAVTCQQKKINA